MRFLPLLIVILALTGCVPADTELVRTIEQWESLPNKPENVRRYVCGGAGVSRLLVYLDGTERLAAVESTDASPASWFAPYRAAHPELQKLPIYSSGHGHDQIEKLLSLQPLPDVIFRLDLQGMGVTAEELQRRTGIPIVLLPNCDLHTERQTLYNTLRLLGRILKREQRAEEIITFFDSEIANLEKRSVDIDTEKSPLVYIGGISYRGMQGLNSTMTPFPPLEWLHSKNAADSLIREGKKTPSSSPIAVCNEQILMWNPDVIFVDAASLSLGNSSGLAELHTSEIYRSLKAVKNKQVYLLLPNSSYSANYSSQLANAWFIGKTLYPDRFADIDPPQKADEIFTFLTGSPVFNSINEKIKQITQKEAGALAPATE
ncbi:MAG: ABC transporter substrate-binding protein [Planctomycetaceae bacterium]|nr:ABC transporter substrate-binding protein [Planctomycetaceae bacterium]